jgi:hypothetical protein
LKASNSDDTFGLMLGRANTPATSNGQMSMTDIRIADASLHSSRT